MNTPPLYHKYRGQSAPQPAFIELDENGEVSADWSGEIGNAVPIDVWDGRTLRWAIRPEISQLALDKLLADGSELRMLLTTVHSGHTVVWDGNNNRGRIDDNARRAVEQLIDQLDEVDFTPVWDAADWLDGCTSCSPDNLTVTVGDVVITATTTDAELTTLADGLGEDANGIYVEGIEDHLEELREDLDKEE